MQSPRHPPKTMMHWWRNMADESLERITILLQAKDRDLQRAIEKNTREVRRFAREASRDTKRMATEIDSHVSRVGRTVMGLGKSFALGLGAGVIGAAFAGVTTNLTGMVRGIAEVGDQAKRSGLSVRAFQEWKFVAEQNRIGIDQLVDGFKELSLRSDEFIQTGAGPAKESLERLGISAAELKEKLKDPSALMLELIGRMEGMDRAAQIRIADELFGGSGGERFVELVAMGETGLRRTIQRGREVGAVLDEEMIQKAAEIDRRFQELSGRISYLLKSAIVAGLAPGDADDMLGSAERAAGLLGEDLQQSLNQNGALLEQQEENVRNLGLAYEALQVSVSAASDTIAGDIAALVEIGATDLAIELADVTAEMENLAAQANAGTIEATELDEEMQSLIKRAADAFSEIEKIDGVDMSGAVAAVDRVASALEIAGGWAAGLVNLLREAAGLAPSEPSMPLAPSDGSSISPPPPPFAPNPNAPRTRPQRPGVNSLGDWIDAGTGSAGGGGGGGGGSRGDEFARSVEQIRERTIALEAEAIAFLEVVGSHEHYADAAEFAQTRARLLADAMKAGKEITPELKAQIDQLAEAYVNASVAAEDAADRLDEMQARAKRGADAVTDIFMAVGEGSDAAKRAIASLLAEMAKVQFQKAMISAASGAGGGFFSFIGGLLGYDGGGYTGNAPRSGGLDGKGGFLAMMHPQETVIDHTKPMARSSNSGQSARDISVHVTAAFDETGNLYVKHVAQQEAAAMGAQINQALPARVQQITARPRGR